MKLNNLGWSEFFSLSFAPYENIGRVAIAHRNQYQLYTEQGDRVATLTGKFRHRAQTTEAFPAVGDWVVIHPQSATNQVLIDAILPRKSKVVRQAAGTTITAQIIAANIDTLFLVSGLDHDFNPRRIERYLAMTQESGANPVILLNKSDLCEDLETKQAALDAIAIDLPVITLSALHQNNLEALTPYFQPGQTIALLGSSGVGKSTLINQLMGQVVQTTQSVRVDDSKGRHTTTHREMLRLPSGALLIDTPGMRELQIWHSEEQSSSSVEETFRDIENLATSCRFRNCQHRLEPGCAIQSALATGELSIQRLNNNHKLQKEEAYQHRRQDKQAQSNTKARWKKITKAVRQTRRNRR